MATRHPVPTDALEKYHTTFYARRSDVSEAGIAKTVAAYKRSLARYFPADRDTPICDIGCGPGSLLRAFAELGYADLRGVDVSAEQIEFCRLHSVGEVFQADAIEFLSTSEAEFGFITMLDVLEHLRKDRAFVLLGLVRDRLRPGGRVLLRVPNMSNPLNLRTRYVDATHELGFSQESLDQILRLTGFEPVVITSESGAHKNPIAHLIFDVILWKLFKVFYRRTMQLKDEPLPGKNLIALAEKAPGPASG